MGRKEGWGVYHVSIRRRRETPLRKAVTQETPEGQRENGGSLGIRREWKEPSGIIEGTHHRKGQILRQKRKPFEKPKKET